MNRYSKLLLEVKNKLIGLNLTLPENVMLGSTEEFLMKPTTFYNRFEYQIMYIGNQEYISQGEITERVVVAVTFIMKKDSLLTVEENVEYLFSTLEKTKACLYSLHWEKATNGLADVGLDLILGDNQVLTEQNYSEGYSVFMVDLSFMFSNFDTKIYQ